MVDSTSKQVLRTIQTEGMRLACASWTSKGCISCGSKNGRIYHHDVRVSKSLIRFFIFGFIFGIILIALFPPILMKFVVSNGVLMNII